MGQEGKIKGSSILRQHLYAIMPGERGQLDAEVQDTGLSRREPRKSDLEGSKVYRCLVTFSLQRTLQGARAVGTVLCGSDADPTPIILSNSHLLQLSSVSSFLLAGLLA